MQGRANGGFYEENDEILKNAIAFTVNEPKNVGEIVEISQIATQIIRFAIPFEGRMRNFDNGQKHLPILK